MWVRTVASIGLCGIERAKLKHRLVTTAGLQSDCVELKVEWALGWSTGPRGFNRTVWN